MKDRFGREIDYLRISVTDKCNLRCRYCMPEEGTSFLRHDEVLRTEEYLQIIRIFQKLGIRKIRLTGGEPLVKNGIVSMVKQIKALGIEEIAMTTNGILLKEMAKDLKEAGLSRINISLDTLDPDKFQYMTRYGNIQDVYDGIAKCHEVGLFPIKLNVVVLRDFNDDEVCELAHLTRDGLDVRFIELMPIGQARSTHNLYVSNKEVMQSIGHLLPVDSEDIHSPATYYRLNDYPGKIGFINPISCNFCHQCNRIRLDCQGNLLLCLHSTRRIPLKDCLRKGYDIEKLIIKSIYEKPESHHLVEGQFNESCMNTIGG